MKSSGRISSHIVDDLARLGEEAVAADVDQEAVVVDRAADAADVARVLLQDGDGTAFLGKHIGRRQAGRSCSDDQGFSVVRHKTPGTGRSRGARGRTMAAKSKALP